MNRLINMHHTQDIIEVVKKRADRGVVSAPSIKLDTDILHMDPERSDYEETDVEIENMDTITAVLQAIKDGYRPLVLNMANSRTPGGGFLTGAKAQEEDLFRCTDYHATLVRSLYPICHDEVIYSPCVNILKDVNYQLLETPQSAGFVAAAAIRNPRLTMYGQFRSFDQYLTESKIRMIYQLGVIQRYDCLILGALGCGAFNNPPFEVAQIFAEVTAEYAQKFRKIIFPIMCGSDNSNCEIFQDTFMEIYRESVVDNETAQFTDV